MQQLPLPRIQQLLDYIIIRLMMENNMNDFHNFKKIFKNLAKRVFTYSNVSIKNLDANEIGILFNNDGFVIDKTKNENSIKIFLRKGNNPDLLLRSFIIVYGSDKEKEYFEKGYNKLFFDSEIDLIGILVFLKNKYDFNIKSFFENDLMYMEIEKFFMDKRKQQEGKKDSFDETRKLIIASMAFSKKLRFTQDGNPYMKD